jgi:hypothetical protein
MAAMFEGYPQGAKVGEGAGFVTEKVYCLLAGLVFVTLAFSAQAVDKTPAEVAPPDARIPVLVELFTSEGCSSCPPADALLQKLDQQPAPAADLIVLSEHVDYWNHLGWKDPFSAHLYSERQSAYARRFGVDSYTPQMVIDGGAQFVGSDERLAEKAIATATRSGKLPVQISSVALDKLGNVTLRLEAGRLAKSAHDAADIYVVLALNHAASSVTAGENSGHRLTHVAVVQSLNRVGTVSRTQAFAREIRVKLAEPSDSRDLRVVAFVQEAGAGRVLGAVEKRLGN